MLTVRPNPSNHNAVPVYGVALIQPTPHYHGQYSLPFAEIHLNCLLVILLFMSSMAPIVFGNILGSMDPPLCVP